MHLNETEQRMQDGEYGRAPALAMTILRDLGALYGAKKMIPVTQAHIDMTLYMVDAGVEFVEHMAGPGARFAVPTQLNPASVDLLQPQKLRADCQVLEKSRRLEAAYLKMGALPTWTCAPYQQGLVPGFGEQIAWGESNAVAFVNSVIGARTQRYADLTDVCAAVCGRVPEMGLHLAENRKATLLVKLEGFPRRAWDDDRIYPLLGFVFGEMVQDRVGAIAGMPKTVSMDRLKAFAAAAASSGAVGLFHAIGVTPEAPDLSACLKHEKPARTLFLSPDMLDEALERLNPAGGLLPDLVALGCPHYSVDEFIRLKHLFGDRKISGNLAFWVFTSRKTHGEISGRGILKDLETTGIQVFTDACPLMFPQKNWNFTRIMSNSAKFANYGYSQTGLDVIFAGTADCVDMAVSGKWQRRPLWK